MSFVMPPKPQKFRLLTEEETSRVRKQNMELFSSMHPFPNSLVEWWVKRKMKGSK